MTSAHAKPSGYAVPVHRSLTEPILLGGAPRMAAILNGTLSAALGLGLQMWAVGLVFWILTHALCVWAAKKDPKFMDVLVRHLRHREYLSC